MPYCTAVRRIADTFSSRPNMKNQLLIPSFHPGEPSSQFVVSSSRSRRFVLPMILTPPANDLARSSTSQIQQRGRSLLRNKDPTRGTAFMFSA
jgi:hypothetical protein